jgi:hypothetical protein
MVYHMFRRTQSLVGPVREPSARTGEDAPAMSNSISSVGMSIFILHIILLVIPLPPGTKESA